jgi:hypothetical protein
VRAGRLPAVFVVVCANICMTHAGSGTNRQANTRCVGDKGNIY